MKGLMLCIAATAIWISSPAPGWAAEKTESEEFTIQLENFLDESDLPGLEFPEIEQLEFNVPDEDFFILSLADEKRGRGNDTERAARHRRHVDRIQLFRLWKVMEDLDLSDDQVDAFFPLMRKHNKAEQDLGKQRNELMGKIKEELDKDKPSDSNLNKLLADLKQNGRAVVEIKNKAIDDAAAILSVQQQARLALTLHNVERNIWESIARVRHGPSEYFRGMDFNKQDLQNHMLELRQNLGRISRELEAKGLPPLDMEIELEEVEEEAELENEN